MSKLGSTSSGDANRPLADILSRCSHLGSFQSANLGELSPLISSRADLMMAMCYWMMQRKKTLLQEYKQQGKGNTFVDRRFGEKDEDLPEEDKAILRFQKERQVFPSLCFIYVEAVAEFAHIYCFTNQVGPSRYRHAPAQCRYGYCTFH